MSRLHDEDRLAAMEARIAEHPLSSGPVREAFAIIEHLGKDNQEAIAQELRERDLPGLDDLGRLQLRTTFSWWRLHRGRRKLLKRLGRSDDE